MATTEEVQKLASLARLSLPEETLEKFSGEFEGILAYIGKLDTLNIDTSAQVTPTVRNVFRDDADAHAPGLYTEKLVAQFPDRKGDYLKVKQIISHD